MANLSDVKKHEANELNTNIHHGLSHHYKCLEQRTLPNGQVYIQVGIVRLYDTLVVVSLFR